MRRSSVTTLIVSLFAATLLGTLLPAHAEDRGSWFKKLMRPDTGTSCCDIADCHRTDADWRGGQWWAVVQGQWTPVPPEKELRNKTSIDGDAYICSSQHPSSTVTIYCFVPPIMSM